MSDIVNLQSRTMDKARIIQSISELQVSMKNGDTESMYRCAHALNLLFIEEVPEPFGGYIYSLLEKRKVYQY